MNILWITWKDEGHPDAGGAEVVCSELCKRLLKDGHQVTLLTSDYPNSTLISNRMPNLKIIRVGHNRYTHPSLALIYYMRHLRNRYDTLIEEVEGGAPYFAVFFERKAKRFLFYHQLAKVNWLYEVKKPFGYVGYFLLVPLATRLISLAKVTVITVSESTRKELAKHGLDMLRTYVISEGIQIEPLKDLSDVEKFNHPTLLSHGSMRAMKRTIDQIKAFEFAKRQIPSLKMKISGSSSTIYGKKVLGYIAQSPYREDIEYLGRTTDAQKAKLMQKCHILLVTSVEEGWCLVVTEANSQGCPAVVYDVNGLRDSVRHTKTGIVTATNAKCLAQGVVALLQDKKAYDTIRHRAYLWSKLITFKQEFKDFKRILDLV